MTVNHGTASRVADLLTPGLLAEVGLAVVIDNSEDPLELARLTQAIAPSKRVQVVATENLGYGAAVNQGARIALAAGHRCLLIMNPDTRLLSPWFVSDALAALDRGFSLVTPAIVSGQPDSDDLRYWFDGGEIDMKRGITPHLRWGERYEYEPRDDVVRESGFATGGAMAVALEAFESLGGFREDLFMYWEDVDLSLRAVAAGHRIGHIPTSVVWHEVGGSQSGKGKSPLFHYYFNRNRVIVAREQGTTAADLVFGTGRTQSLYLLWRAVREPEQRTRCLYSAIRGMASGFRNG